MKNKKVLEDCGFKTADIQLIYQKGLVLPFGKTINITGILCPIKGKSYYSPTDKKAGFLVLSASIPRDEEATDFVP